MHLNKSLIFQHLMMPQEGGTTLKEQDRPYLKISFIRAYLKRIIHMHHYNYVMMTLLSNTIDNICNNVVDEFCSKCNKRPRSHNTLFPKHLIYWNIKSGGRRDQIKRIVDGHLQTLPLNGTACHFSWRVNKLQLLHHYDIAKIIVWLHRTHCKNIVNIALIYEYCSMSTWYYLGTCKLQN